MNRRLLVGIIVVVVLAGIGGYWYFMRPAPAESVIVIGTTWKLETSMDPGKGSTALDAFVIKHCYDRLFELSEPDLENIPGIASSYEVNEDVDEYTIHLREDLKFHDGSPINATAVKFSIERSKEFKAPASYYTGVVKEVEVIDEYTVKLTLKDPFSLYKWYISSNEHSVVNPNVVEKYGDDYLYDHDAGSGRFILKEYVPREKVVLEANKDHWDPPKVDKVIIKVFAEKAALRTALEAGEIDLAIGFPPMADQVALKENPDFEVYKGGSSVKVQWIFGFKCGEPYNNSLVKKAIACAIDIEEMTHTVFEDMVVPLYSIVAHYARDYTPVFERYTPRNIARAKEYLVEAGYPEGLEFDLYIYPWQTEWRFMGEFFKEQLADAGITLNIHTVETSVLWSEEMAFGGNCPSFFDYSGYWMPDADCQIELCLDSSHNKRIGSYYNNSYVDQLIAEERIISNETRRREIFLELQEINAKEVAYIPLYDYSDIIAAAKYVKGLYDHNEYYPIFLHDIYLEK